MEEWNLLLAGADDLEFVEDCDEPTVRDRLEDAVDSTEALDLVLYLFDGSLSDEIRRTASLELDELLVYPEIKTYLESILLPAHWTNRPIQLALDAVVTPKRRTPRA